jgi:hypothetical protein
MAINFKRLEEIASSLKRDNQTGQSFHVTFVYRGNKLIKIGQNNYRKQHRSNKYGDYHPYKNKNAGYVPGIHSEIDSLIRLGTNDCFDYGFVNIRIGNDGTPKISKPCVNCMRVLKQTGYKYLWYYDGNQYVKEKY